MTQIITPTQLKEQSLIDVNVENFYCDAAIKAAQEIDLVQVIGENLYNKILTLISGNTLSGKYKELVDNYIINFLLYDATAEIQLPLSYKNRNAGVVRTTDESVESAALKDLQYITQYYKNRADFFTRTMLSFIIRNKSSFPEFCTETCNQISPSETYNCPLNI